MYNDPKRQIRRILFQGGFPATLILIALNVATWLMRTLLGTGNISDYLIFTHDTWPRYFWSIVTWPVHGAAHPVTLLMGSILAYILGGSLERSWGTRTYVGFLFSTAALTAATLWIGASLLGAPLVLNGLWIAMAPLMVAWCIINAREKILLYFVIQIPAPVMAWATVLLLWLNFGPILGFFAMSGCAAAYWYTTKARFTLSRGGERDRIRSAAKRFVPDRERINSGRDGFNLMRWWKERQEKKRLEEIFRRSGFTDDDNRR